MMFIFNWECLRFQLLIFRGVSLLKLLSEKGPSTLLMIIHDNPHATFRLKKVAKVSQLGKAHKENINAGKSQTYFPIGSMGLVYLPT